MIINKSLFFVKIVIIFLLFFQNSYSNNNVYIKYKVENDIITNLDIIKEQQYLIALNNNLKNLKENEISELAKNSIINEKIKKIELIKIFDFSKADAFLGPIFENFYKRFGFKNEKEFEQYLTSYDIKINTVKEKVKIESLWNKFIFDKFNKQVSINEDDLKKRLKLQIAEKEMITEYNISEILFEIKAGDVIEKKIEDILDSIEANGFENTSNLFSISPTSKFGGKIGWVKETQLSKFIVDELKKMDIGKISTPIQSTNGYLLLKINDKREQKQEIDFENEYKKLLNKERDRQLGQFSLIYFNRIKQRVKISEN